MPKCKDKKTKQKEPTSGGKISKNQNTLKKKKLGITLTDSIDMSRQLASKATSSRIRTTRSNSKISEPRICGNGKPMPSLAELEKMFEDSDEDDESVPTVVTKRCKTPENFVKPGVNIPVSPKTLKNITTKVIDFISANTDSSLTLEDKPRPPVISQKKPKKSGIPYIVGCKDRPQVIRKPTVSFCKGVDDYGIDSNSNSQDENQEHCPKKRKKRSEKVNISKSIFNAKSDEIATRLKELENGEVLSDGSTDSNKTVSYEFMNSSLVPGNQCRSFSPLPSTSKDNDTYLQNVKRFNDSLQLEDVSNVSHQNDLEIIEIPCETIIIDADKTPENNILEIIELDVQEQSNCFLNSDKVDSPIDVEDYYSSIDLYADHEPKTCEVVDIDEVLAENKAIIEKYSKMKNLNTVTEVKPNLVNEKQSKYNIEMVDALNSSDINTSTINKYKIGEIVSDFFKNQKPQSARSRKTRVKERLSSYEKTDLTNEIPSSLNEKIQCWVSGINKASELHCAKRKSKLKHITNSSVYLDDSSKSCLDNLPVIDIASDYLPQAPRSLSQQANDNSVIFVDSFPAETNNQNINSIAIRVLNDRPTLVRDIQIINGNESPSSNYRHTNNFITVNHVTQETFNDNNSHVDNSAAMIRNFTSLDHNYMTVNNNPVNNAAAVIRNASLDHNYLTVTPNIQKSKKPKKGTKNKANAAIPLEKPVENETPRSIADCPICMENMSNKEVASTLCGHLFCMKCIKAAIKASGKRCPNCRKVLKGVGYHQIFL